MKPRNQTPSSSEMPVLAPMMHLLRPAPKVASKSDTEVVGKSSFEAMWQDFHAKNLAEETPPKNAICVAEYARLNGCSMDSAYKLLDSRKNKGTLSSGLYRRVCEGTTRKVCYWWPNETK